MLNVKTRILKLTHLSLHITLQYHIYYKNSSQYHAVEFSRDARDVSQLPTYIQ